jgi:predicted ATPase
MWRSVEVKNFKSLSDVKVDFGALTVLVGPNGAGKSSLLLAAQLLAELTSPPPIGVSPDRRIRERYAADDRYAPAKLRTRSAPADAAVELRGVAVPGAWNTPEDRVLLALRHSQPDDPEQLPWVGIQHNSSQLVSLTHDNNQQQSMTGQQYASALARELSRLGHGPSTQLSLDARALARPSFMEGEHAELRSNGYGLPSLLAAMAATDRARVEAVEEGLRRIAPNATRIRTPPTRISRNETQIITIAGQDRGIDVPREHAGHRLQVEMKGAGWLDAEYLSDGTLVALGILTLLHSEACPKLLLIDDLDHSLHPTAYAELIDCLRKVLMQRADFQIISTTHAPYLLDQFEPEEVRVLSLDDFGHTAVKPLIAHPEWSETYRGSLSTGELWSAIGSTWVSASGRE